ncbi:anti-sigma factor [Peribacillus cavernae]|uniref:Anti-sigma factor n=1 Tax=Peribacillus cavernae TaxID=1674310 RepID=A0A3S1B570_9BACI|nr:anti-sigma factor [Peribacillus cavernae]MDQ0220153.1 anti-sigma factor RsiW [Peribacillus cavernae]RUQ28785.1 anti-sigma factor [Peribacillus cavernae]
MQCPDEIIDLMHQYLDEDIKTEDEISLREHLRSCQDCQVHFHELKKAVALVQSTSSMAAPAGFTQRVTANLPKEKRKAGAERWLKKHPFLTAVSLFFVLMAGAMFGTYNQDQNFSVSKQVNLVVENETVIVPKGKTVKGDVVVQNGDIRIEGDVQGDVTVINGHNYLASAGSVTGDMEEVDQIFEWLWFKMKNTAKAIFQMNEDK